MDACFCWITIGIELFYFEGGNFDISDVLFVRFLFCFDLMTAFSINSRPFISWRVSPRLISEISRHDKCQRRWPSCRSYATNSLVTMNSSQPCIKLPTPLLSHHINNNFWSGVTSFWIFIRKKSFNVSLLILFILAVVKAFFFFNISKALDA